MTWSHNRGVILDPAQRFTERTDPHVGFGSGRQNQLKFVFIGLGSIAPAAVCKYFAAPAYPGGKGERFLRHAMKQQIGLPVDFVPVVQQQGSLYSETAEPEVIVADRPPFEQCFRSTQRPLLILPLGFQQSEQTEDYRSDKAGAGRLRYVPTLTRERQGFCSKPLYQRDLRAIAQDYG